MFGKDVYCVGFVKFCCYFMMGVDIDVIVVVWFVNGFVKLWYCLK